MDERPYPEPEVSPYPGVKRDYRAGTGWWLRCVICGYNYPLNAAVKADCCKDPETHVWSNDRDLPTD